MAPFARKLLSGNTWELESASESTGIGDFTCPACFQPTRFVRASASGTRGAYFAHKTANSECTFGTKNTEAAADDHVGDASFEVPRSSVHEMSPWHAEWQNIAAARICKEARGLGDSRPRDLADRDTGDIVELQHSHIDEECFAERNASAPNKILWIFDATGNKCWKYGDCVDAHGHQVSFCADGFRIALPTAPNVQVLFHCADGLLRKAVCDTPCLLKLPDAGDVHVRLLVDDLGPDVHTLLNSFFGWQYPLWEWPGFRTTPVLHVANGRVRVMSEEGRLFFDGVHRKLFGRIPTAKLTVFQGPPGAGKTTLLKQTLTTWAYRNPTPRVLVVTFNKNNADVLRREIGSQSVDVSTMDGLCAKPAGTAVDFDATCSDYTVLNRYCAAEVDRKKGQFAMVNKLKHGGGQGCAGLLTHRLKHPHAEFTLCAKHNKLGWDLEFDTYPLRDMIDHASTFASRRYLCDRDQLLRKRLSKYDVVIVDEMQDLLSAQEQRLLGQASCPIVLIGDVNQAINAFANKFDGDGCAENACSMAQEQGAELPPSIEMYGTHRLDRRTAQFLEAKTRVRMHSFRDESERCTVRWKTAIQHETHTLVLCRKNESVIQTATASKGMRIVGGADLKKKLQAARRSTDEKPFSKYARGLSETAFQRICKLLEDRSIDLEDLASRCNVSAASTVHQCKGFECDHVTLHEDLLECSEAAVLYVAMTRHRKSLTVITGRGDGQEFPKRRRVDAFEDGGGPF